MKSIHDQGDRAYRRGLLTLKDRKAMEEIRDHRRRLLNENRMRKAVLADQLGWITNELQDEISIVEAALSDFRIENQPAELNYQGRVAE